MDAPAEYRADGTLVRDPEVDAALARSGLAGAISRAVVSRDRGWPSLVSLETACGPVHPQVAEYVLRHAPMTPDCAYGLTRVPTRWGAFYGDSLADVDDVVEGLDPADPGARHVLAAWRARRGAGFESAAEVKMPPITHHPEVDELVRAVYRDEAALGALVAETFGVEMPVETTENCLRLIDHLRKTSAGPAYVAADSTAEAGTRAPGDAAYLKRLFVAECVSSRCLNAGVYPQKCTVGFASLQRLVREIGGDRARLAAAVAAVAATRGVPCLHTYCTAAGCAEAAADIASWDRQSLSTQVALCAVNERRKLLAELEEAFAQDDEAGDVRVFGTLYESEMSVVDLRDALSTVDAARLRRVVAAWRCALWGRNVDLTIKDYEKLALIVPPGARRRELLDDVVDTNVTGLAGQLLWQVMRSAADAPASAPALERLRDLDALFELTPADYDPCVAGALGMLLRVDRAYLRDGRAYAAACDAFAAYLSTRATEFSAAAAAALAAVAGQRGVDKYLASALYRVAGPPRQASPEAAGPPRQASPEAAGPPRQASPEAAGTD